MNGFGLDVGRKRQWRRTIVEIVQAVLCTLGLAVVTTVWLVGAIFVVGWYHTLPCPHAGWRLHSDPGPGAGFALMVGSLVAWIPFGAYTFFAAGTLYNLRKRRAITSVALAAGALLLTWGYLAVMIPWTTPAGYIQQFCGGEHPPAWPPIPIPAP